MNPNKDYYDKITSATLSPQPSIQYQTPQEPPIYPISGLNQQMEQTMQLTQPEQQAQDIGSQLAALNQQLVGESTARAEAEKEQGIPLLTQTQNDLSSRLKALQNEALAIPMQLQQDSVGRGRTAQGLQPIQTAALRNNAIQALSVNSLLEASRGNLATAIDMVDRAVAQRFDPIREQIAAKSKNLEIILNSPAYSLAEKKRAYAQQEIQNAKQRAIEDQSANMKEIHNIAIMAQGNGADRDTVQRILSSRNPDDALLAANAFMQDPRLQLQLQQLRQNLYYDRLEREAALHPPTPGGPAPLGPITDQSAHDLSGVLASNKVGATTKTLIGTILGVLNAAEDMAKSSNGGQFPGISPLNVAIDYLPFRNALRQKGGTENLGYINGINLKIQQWASGAALTEAQTEQVARMTPNKNDTDANVRIKLNNLANFMQQQIKGALQAEGVQYEPSKIDYFSQPQTLEDIFK